MPGLLGMNLLASGMWGIGFALVEMRTVLARVLERAQLRAADPKLDEPQFRGIVLAPRHGTRVVMERPPAPR